MCSVISVYLKYKSTSDHRLPPSLGTNVQRRGPNTHLQFDKLNSTFHRRKADRSAPNARVIVTTNHLRDHRTWRRRHPSAPGPSISWSCQRSLRSHHQSSTSGPGNVDVMRSLPPTRYHDAHCDQTESLSRSCSMSLYRSVASSVGATLVSTPPRTGSRSCRRYVTCDSSEKMTDVWPVTVFGPVSSCVRGKGYALFRGHEESRT
jgi:hypothetical protein